MAMRPETLALIDGEHYAPVVRAALQKLGAQYHFVAALFVGGREKLREAPGEDPLDALQREYGLPVFTLQRLAGGRLAGAGQEVEPQDKPGEPGRGRALEGRSAGGDGRLLATALRALLSRTGAVVVLDLSDEPVLGYRERFLLMSVAASCGVAYVGADFELRPQSRATVSRPALAVIGTGKRVGKTAVSGRLARELTAAGEQVVVLAMGRGGPPEPEIVRGQAGIGPDQLLAASRRGRHAASDHYEDAALAGVTTIGCRRCGGGLAGAAFDSTVPQALGLLEQQPASLVILEGSGSVVPPVAADATICVSSAAQPVEYITGYLGTYRLLVSDLLVLTSCEPPFVTPAELERLLSGIGQVRPDLEVVPTVFRPRPQQDVRGRRVAFFTTAAPESLPALTAYLREALGAEVVAASAALADRPALAESCRLAQHEAEVFLTEIKAAAIDVVAEAAVTAGRELVFCDNEVLSVAGDELTPTLLAQARLAQRRFAARQSAESP